MNASTSLGERRAESPYGELAQRIVTSAQFKSSPKLREFFLYVVDCSLRDAPEEATEQQIGIHVFHRAPGYNSSDDSIVRSQARLLRLKLAGYFAEEGAQEEVIIEIPKGHYLPIFRPARQSADRKQADISVVEKGNQSTTHLPETTVTPAVPFPRRLVPMWRYLVTSAIGIALGILFGLGWGRVWSPLRNTGADLFWKPFLIGEPPLVIYSNPLFTGTPYTGMRLVSPGIAASSSNFTDVADDTYTGTGEASAIHDLTRVFDAHHQEFILKRSRLVTWDEAKSRNLIFIGAASQNGALHDLKANSDFEIKLDDDHQGYILNRHPLPGEPSKFKPSSSSDEYAVIASFPGVQPGTRIVIFTGLTTNGTEAAVEFMCNPISAQQLIKAIKGSADSLVPFESVLHIKINGGVPMQADIAAIHIHT